MGQNTKKSHGDLRRHAVTQTLVKNYNLTQVGKIVMIMIIIIVVVVVVVMGTMKMLRRNGNELETLIQAVRIYSKYIGIKFGIKKFATLIRKSRKRHKTDLPNQDKIREMEKLKIVGNIGRKQHQTSGDKRKKYKEFLWRNRN